MTLSGQSCSDLEEDTKLWRLCDFISCIFIFVSIVYIQSCAPFRLQHVVSPVMLVIKIWHWRYIQRKVRQYQWTCNSCAFLTILRHIKRHIEVKYLEFIFHCAFKESNLQLFNLQTWLWGSCVQMPLLEPMQVDRKWVQISSSFLFNLLMAGVYSCWPNWASSTLTVDGFPSQVANSKLDHFLKTGPAALN